MNAGGASLGQATGIMNSIDPKRVHQTAEFKHERPLTTCRIDPSGKYVFAGAEDLNIYRWDLAQGGKTTLTGHESWVRSMDFSADGQWLLSGGWDGRVGWWPLGEAQPKPARMIEAHAGWVRSVRARSDGKLIATCGNDNLVKVWDAEQTKPIWQLAGHQRHVYSVDFHPGGRFLASSDLIGVVKVWDLESGKETRTLDASVMTGYDKKFAADMGGARDMRFSPDGKLLACAGITDVRNAFGAVQGALVLLLDWESGKALRQLKDGDYQGVGWGVRFHPDGFIIATAAHSNGSGVLWFFRPDAEKPFHTLILKASGRSLDTAPDQQTLATAQADGHLRLYRMTAPS